MTATFPTFVLDTGRGWYALNDAKEHEVDAPVDFRLDCPDQHCLHFGYGLHSCLDHHINQMQIPESVKRLFAAEQRRAHRRSLRSIEI